MNLLHEKEDPIEVRKHGVDSVDDSDYDGDHDADGDGDDGDDGDGGELVSVLRYFRTKSARALSACHVVDPLPLPRGAIALMESCYDGIAEISGLRLRGIVWSRAIIENEACS